MSKNNPTLMTIDSRIREQSSKKYSRKGLSFGFFKMIGIDEDIANIDKALLQTSLLRCLT
jgi:hypothetical protein